MNKSFSPGKERSWKLRFPFMIWILVKLVLAATVVMLLWNAIVTDLFSIREITWLQSLGLIVLVRLLTGNFGRPSRFRGWRGGGPPPHVIEKWKNMTEEERLRFKEEWRKRCAEKRR